MSNKVIKVITILLIAASVLIGLYAYPQLPERVASHWNAAGEVDGYMSRFWGVFILPIILVAMYLLLIFLPRIDPFKKNIESFKQYYNGIILTIIVFLFYVYILSIAANLGWEFNMTLAIIPMMAIFIFVLGALLKKTKRNWFMGIRTPWTLSSDSVWDKTHLLGSKLFMMAGVITIFGIFFPKYTLYLGIFPLIIAAVVTIIYSYIFFQQEQRQSSK